MYVFGGGGVPNMVATFPVTPHDVDDTVHGFVEGPLEVSTRVAEKVDIGAKLGSGATVMGFEDVVPTNPKESSTVRLISNGPVRQ